ncbi:MAG: hypothetical protein AAF705_08250 [Bacteroidota bacterium]
MTTLIQKSLILTLALFGLLFSGCQKEEDKVQTFSDVRDYAVGAYNYTLEWHDISTGTPERIEGLDLITGTFEVRKNSSNDKSIDLIEDGEVFFSFDDVWESPEGFSFNQSWLQLPFEGSVYSFFPYDIFPMEGTTEAGVYYKESKELKIAFFVEINGVDLSMTIEGAQVR